MPSTKRLHCASAGVAAALLLIVATAPAIAEPVPVQEVSSQEDIEAALSGGVPMGRWKEGLLFDGISPQPWLKSAANWFPNTEEVQPNEMRIIFMGTSPDKAPKDLIDGMGAEWRLREKNRKVLEEQRKE